MIRCEQCKHWYYIGRLAVDHDKEGCCRLITTKTAANECRTGIDPEEFRKWARPVVIKGEGEASFHTGRDFGCVLGEPVE